jgi:hypothetical protein
MLVYVRICYANVHYVVRIGYDRSQFIKFDFCHYYIASLMFLTSGV